MRDSTAKATLAGFRTLKSPSVRGLYASLMPLTPWSPHARTEGASRWKKRFDGSTSPAGPNSIRLSSGLSSHSPLRTWIRSLRLQALHFPQLSRHIIQRPYPQSENLRILLFTLSGCLSNAVARLGCEH